jgi:chitodextrinase
MLYVMGIFTKSRSVATGTTLIAIALGIGFSVIVVRHLRPASGAALPTHFVSVFSVDSSSSLDKVASLGIGGILNYGSTYTGTDAYSKQLASRNMTIIDALPWTYLRQYGQKTLTEAQMLTNLTNHLKAVQNNSLIIGYWVLDDWNYGTGSAKTALQEVTSLIHQYTPGRPSICGFGGGLNSNGKGGGFQSGALNNFSPQGCDMVAPYIYADNNSHGTYDWALTTVLPGMFSDLKAKGWNQAQTPLIGVPDAFGGGTWPVPNGTQVEAQAKAYCQNGAVGIIYYAYNESNGVDISNNSSIQQGVKAGTADCQSIWGATKTTTVLPTPPTNLHSTVVTTTGITLAWNASSDTGGPGLAGYKLYQNGTLKATLTGTGTTTVVGGLSANTAYSYQLSAYDTAGGESSRSSAVSVRTANTGTAPSPVASPSPSSPSTTPSTTPSPAPSASSGSTNQEQNSNTTGTSSSQTVRLSIVVVDQQTNQPVKDASVSYGNQTATTDSKGQAVLSDVPVGTIVITVHVNGRQTRETVQVTRSLTGTQSVVFKVPTSKDMTVWIIAACSVMLLIAVVFGRLWMRRRNTKPSGSNLQAPPTDVPSVPMSGPDGNANTSL